MKLGTVLSAGLLLAAFTAETAAVPIQTMTEKWDTYATGTGDADYNAIWAAIPGASRYPVETGPFGSATVWSPPNGLKIGKLRSYGIARDLAPEITAGLPDGTMVIGTDADVLRVRFIVDFNGINRQQEDIFVELSRGGIHVDQTSGTPKDVIAFGMTHGWLGPSPHPRIFDGKDWILATGVATDKRSNHFTLQIRSDTLTLLGDQRASGSHTVDREYAGGFDTISIRTISQNDQTHMLDDVVVWGGEVVAGPPPPAPTVASVDPAGGPTAGGTAVTIRGENFQAGAAVRFGGTPAAGVAVVSTTEIACVTPPHGAGPVTVEVGNPDGGSGALDGAFTYVAGTPFIRGGANADGRLDIGDAVAILQFLFAHGPMDCVDAADVNDDGRNDIGDPIVLLNYLFAGGRSPEEPFEACGVDPTEDDLDCERYPACE